jgi:hypothetical protein
MVGLDRGRCGSLSVSCDTGLRRWKSEMALVALFYISEDRDELPHPPPSVTRASTLPEALARLDKARTEGAKLQAIEEEQEADCGD